MGKQDPYGYKKLLSLLKIVMNDGCMLYSSDDPDIYKNSLLPGYFQVSLKTPVDTQIRQSVNN